MSTIQSIARRCLRQGFANKEFVMMAAEDSLRAMSMQHTTLSMRTFATSYLDKGDVTDRVLSVVKNFDKVDQSKITPSAVFQKDLGLDSLDTVELVMAIEEEFAIEIPDTEADKILSCDDAITYISSNPMAK